MKPDEIFSEAISRPPSDRPAYIAHICGDDHKLRRHLEALVHAHENPESFFAPQPAALGATIDEPSQERMDTVIGPYSLLEQIGEGGMGTVWMAQQTEPVKRVVAVKLIKAGMDSKQVIARFEAERQALALMDHPNIAKVLDAGTVPEAHGLQPVGLGRPYFVMELVKGAPITKYCDEHHLTPRQRLELFVPVCHAIQHAHQKGIIHRDLKPSNIIIALIDGKPVPKVIDFGVAKAVGQSLTDKTLVTGFGAIVGTPEYMSPEQAEINQLDIDTRSDIYSLGVLLYELLTGSPPFSRKDLEKAGMLEMLRVIREQEPSKPSTKLSSSDALPTLSANRGTEPAKLTRLVRGELDWIVMKALEKDRNRRYETPNSFAMDVQRYLADEPVQACPPSAGYRLRKFVRRNKGPVVAAFLVAVALLGGVIGTTVGLVRAERAKDTAEKRLSQIEKGIDLLGAMFADLDPFAEEKEGRPLRMILGDRLDQAVADLDGEALGDPLVVARLQDRLGQTYLGLGQAAKAEALFNRVVATRAAHLGGEDPLTLAARHNQALATAVAGKMREAFILFGQVHAARVKVLGADHPDTLTTLHHLGNVSIYSGNENVAVRLLEQARDGRVRRLGEHHEHTLQTLEKLAVAYQAMGRHAEAFPLVEQVWAAQVKKYGEDHPRAIEAMYRLAATYSAGYKMKRSLDLFEQARKLAVPKLGLEHPLTLRILQSLGIKYRVYQKTDQAIALLELVREKQVMLLGIHHPTTLRTLHQLGQAYQDAGRLEKALTLTRQAAEGVERQQFACPTNDPIIPSLYFLYELLNQYDQAEVWRRKWMAVIKERDGPESDRYVGLGGLAGLGWNLLKQQKYAEADPILRESLAVLEKNMPGAWVTCYTQTLIGGALLGQKKYGEAEPLLVDGYRGMKKTEKTQGHQGPDRLPEHVSDTLERLVQLFDETNKPVEAARWREELKSFKKDTEAHSTPKGK